ncbi:hypothetical protein GTW51_19665 [Aurantimonas aggregata]|uniref:Uncharacterized protein n=1 Tax=Aurantimonas aggregata TaxID=2047720 RepID=A0A6L9MNC4_9HYPH|nr:hypothetical protein [Aurantimonas aggregata]NDV88908.1 hypothetical protein [Aurantimonas aggregata]
MAAELAKCLPTLGIALTTPLMPPRALASARMRRRSAHDLQAMLPRPSIRFSLVLGKGLLEHLAEDEARNNLTMDPTLVPLLSALAGAVIGSTTTLITLLVQTRAAERRPRREFLTKLAVEERNKQVELPNSPAMNLLFHQRSPISRIFSVSWMCLSKAASHPKARELAAQNAELMQELVETHENLPAG